ncbi:hypothetical protein [Pseudomonas sp. LF245]|jgi:hypothetical protein
MAHQQWTHLIPEPGKKEADYMRGTVKEGNASRPFSADALNYINSPRTEFAGEQYHSSPANPADATGVLAVISRAYLPDGTYRVGEQPFNYAAILTPGDQLHLAESGFITVTNNPDTQEVSGRMYLVAETVVFDVTYNVSPEAK